MGCRCDGLQVAIQSSWGAHGVPMGVPWPTHGILMVYSHGHPWATRGPPTGCHKETWGSPWPFHGLPTCYSWSTLVGHPCVTCGLPTDCHKETRDTHGMPMGCPWATHISPTGYPWGGPPMGYQLATYMHGLPSWAIHALSVARPRTSTKPHGMPMGCP